MTAARRYVTIWLAWTAAGLFYSTQDFIPRLYRNEPVPWVPVFVGWMAAMYVCAVFTPALLWAGRRWPIEQGSRWRRVALHAGLSAIFSVVTAAIEPPVLRALDVLPQAARTASLTTLVAVFVVSSFHGGMIRYWAVIGLQAVYRSHQLQLQSSELTAQLSAAQLSALKMQLQPHFLFNTLSAIMSLVRQREHQQAEAMIARLSDLLRLTLDDVDAQEVPLWRELEFLRLYLSIEQVRFQDRLRVDVIADPDLSDAFVPHMALQPIVENAVRHGLGQSEQCVSIQVKAARTAESLMLTVTDDGPGSPNGFEAGGIGLVNTRSRLARLYGTRAGLVAENISPRGVRVTITLPFHAERVGEWECV
jgi:two-component system, LytTR family, sensor kinase